MKSYLQELKEHYETLYSKSFLSWVVKEYTIFGLIVVVFVMTLYIPFMAFMFWKESTK